MSDCAYCDDQDTSANPTRLYVAEDGSRAYLHPACFAEMQDLSPCDDDENVLRAWVMEGDES